VPHVITAGLESLAKAWIADEPQVATGVSAQVAVRPFRRGFPR
jgi:hypothetical protein